MEASLSDRVPTRKRPEPLPSDSSKRTRPEPSPSPSPSPSLSPSPSSDHSGSSDSDSNPTQNDSTLAKLFSTLETESDPSAIMGYLSQLCEVLSFSMDDRLVGMRSLDGPIKMLVRFIGYESNPDIMLLAIRSLTYLCDAIPGASLWVSKLKGVEAICGKLLAIEYLDVAEQCLQALEKISKQQPVPCLHAGTIMAVLSYIDFFSTSVQRVALCTVANVCKKLPLDCSSLVMDSVPALCNLLQHEDRKVVETSATCLIRITDCFSSSSELMDQICSCGVIDKILPLIAPNGRMSLSQTTTVELIGLLTKLAAKSLLAVKSLFELNISSILKAILMMSDHAHGASYSSSQDLPANQVHEVFKLLNQLIPTITQDSEAIQLNLAKEKILADEPKFLCQFSNDILPVSVQLATSEASLYVSYCSVTIISSVIYFGTPDMISDLLMKTNISSFLAGMLASKKDHVVFPTLKIVENLMRKLPGVFTRSFIKEGVIYAINILTLDGPSRCSNQQSDHSNANMPARHASRCFCYAHDSPCSSGAKTCKLGNKAVYYLAEHIRSSYLCNESMDNMSNILRKLKAFCGELNDNGIKFLTNDIAEKEDYLSDILGQALHELNSGESMSTFEFIESGIVKSLAHYLCNGRYLQDASDNSLSNHCLSVLTRFQTFAAISLSNSGLTWEDMLLTSLVRKLQSVLVSFDNFPVILTNTFKHRVQHVDIPFKKTTVHPCLRVCFINAEGEENLCNSNQVLSVEISSSVVDFENFLLSKSNGSKKSNREARKGKEAKSNKIDLTSTSEHADGVAPQERATVLMEPKVLNMEGQTLLVDTSAKLSNLMSEYSKPPCSSQEHIHESSSYSSSKDVNPKLIFTFEGKQLDPSVTLYQAILQNRQNVDPDLIMGSQFLNDVYRVTYKRAQQNITSAEPSSSGSESTVFWDRIGFSWHKLPFFSSLLLAKLSCKLDRSNPSYDILFLMRIIEGLNRNSFQLLSNDKSVAFAQGRIENFDDLKVSVPTIPQAEFVSTKLTEKLEQQMQDPLAVTPGGMPLWCTELMAVCPFLFSFETRCKYFHLTAFGSSVTQQPQLAHVRNMDYQQRSTVGMPYRKRFKVDRSNIMKSAAKMMEAGIHKKIIVEVEYSEEVGTGLGPTMEFYTLVSHEFQKTGLGMWRGDGSLSSNDGGGYVDAHYRLFPRPWSAEARISNKVKFCDVINKFKLLGQLVAEAIKDKRIFDMPFSRAFYKVILEQELSIYDIQFIDPDLGKTLLEFKALVDRKRYLESISRENCCSSSALHYRDTKIEDLCLEFTLPGYDDYLLRADSNPKAVDINNLEEYVELLVGATIKDGICKQVEAFKSGFCEVCPLRNLQIFTEDELERLLCGEQDTWEFTQLLDHIKCDHGYTASSTSISHLLEILQEFGNDRRRAFLQFVTGAPRLPPGGLAALNPKMTVVRKHSSNNPDMDLPSVMTCTNYLKLPSYSTKEKMREKLLYALNEGQGSFDLS